MASGYEILKVTDGTSTVDLLNLSSGYSAAEWRQTISQYKGDGTWSQSSMSDGRVLVAKHFDNAQETFPFPAIVGGENDITINALSDLLILCEKASDYWKFTWQDSPVWLVARSKYETNTRYAYLLTGSIPQAGDVINRAFGDDSILVNLELRVERSQWGEVEIGRASCRERVLS